MITKLGKTTPCRGCGADIAFIRTTAGKSIPVDPFPISFVPEGGPNTYVMMDGNVKRGREPKRDEDQVVTQIGYRSHFATCPAADRFSGVSIGHSWPPAEGCIRRQKCPCLTARIPL